MVHPTWMDTLSSESPKLPTWYGTCLGCRGVVSDITTRTRATSYKHCVRLDLRIGREGPIQRPEKGDLDSQRDDTILFVTAQRPEGRTTLCNHIQVTGGCVIREKMTYRQMMGAYNPAHQPKPVSFAREKRGKMDRNWF